MYIIHITLYILKYRLEYTCYFICTDNELKIVIIIGGVVTLTTIIMIYTISREEEEYLYTHPIPAEDEGKNGLLVLPKRHWILTVILTQLQCTYCYNTYNNL